MLNIEKSKSVIPPPIAQPIIPIVQGKKTLPAKATTSPNIMASGPSIYGLSMKNLENVVAENTGQAFLWLAVIIG